MALPQFGLYSSVRVCSDCFNGSSRYGKHDQQSTLDGANFVTNPASRSDITADIDLKAETTAEHHRVLHISECKCGMPLCICEAPVASEKANKLPSTSTPVKPKPKKAENMHKVRGSTSNKKLSSPFNLGQVTNSSLDKCQMDYEVTGEGLREAIKNVDIAAVKKLLNEGVDANYCDKQGLSLLHLAALFNQTDIAFALMDYGASLDCKNSQGETPLECAPATLEYKMRKKMEEAEQHDPQHIT